MPKPNVGIVLFAHGSSVPSANDAVRQVAACVGQSGEFPLLETAFLDPVRPGLDDAVDALIEKGANRIVVIPYFLTLGLHLQRDLPALVSRLQHIHEGVDFVVTRPLDGHGALAAIVADRARQALKGQPAE